MSEQTNTLVEILYLVSAVVFIYGLKGLTRVRTARRGNALSSLAMLIAIVATLIGAHILNPVWILVGLVVGGGIGAFVAIRVQMTEMPEMVALFNGCGGAASTFVALSVIWLELLEKAANGQTPALTLGAAPAITLVLSVFIGTLTFSGSIIAFLKLRGWISGKPILFPGRHVLNGLLILGSLGVGAYFAFSTSHPTAMMEAALVITAASLALGVFLVIPIGGADMPVVISLLNSYSGLAACATGFVLSNNLLIIAGALVGASGLILTQIMCVAMNRSLTNVLFGGFGADETTGGAGDTSEYGPVRGCGADEAALVLESAESVIFVPGYGLAVAQAQHTVRELANLLQSRGCDVKYAIHPVAGRMPGHMNVLLAEADVPYEELFELERINSEFKNTDVVVVIGANDVVNPAATDDKTSPIYGMPVLQVWEGQTVIMIKRSLSPGFAGIKNALFEYDNTMMLFADAKQALQDMVTELKEAT